LRERKRLSAFEAKCINFLKKLLLFLLMSLYLIGWFAIRTAADAPTQPPQQLDFLPDILQNASSTICTSGGNDQPATGCASPVHLEVPKHATSTAKRLPTGHSTRSEKAVSADSLQQYLQRNNSPLADYAPQIASSSYSSLIIGICAIEQYNCTRAPNYNYWGLMGKTGLQKFSNMGQGIQAIDSFLTKAENNGRTTVESFRGWYCQSACTNWESTVLKVKAQVEALP